MEVTVERSIMEEHLATIRRKTSPTAIGRMPPDFFFAAKRFAEHNPLYASLGALPLTNRLANSVREDKALSAEVGLVQLIASFRWAAFSPEGPPAEAAGKDLIAFRTVLVENTTGGGTGRGGDVGGEV